MMLNFKLLRPNGDIIWEAVLDYLGFQFPFQFLENGHITIHNISPGASPGETITPPWVIRIEFLFGEGEEKA